MIINDEQTLKYRTALQVERDYLANELGVFAEDLRTMLKEMRNRGIKPEYSQNVKNYGLSVIERLANAHLELQFPEFWPTESATALPKIVDATARYIFPLAENSKEVVSTMVEVTVPGQMEQYFAQIHGEMQKTPANPTIRTAQASTPPQANIPTPKSDNEQIPVLTPSEVLQHIDRNVPLPQPKSTPPQPQQANPQTTPPNNQTK